MLSFVKEYSDQIDIFCFQEVYRSSIHQVIAKGMHSNIFGEVSSVLTHHTGYFAKHLSGRDLEVEVSFPLDEGLAIFIRKDIEVNECQDFFVYRNEFTLIDDNLRTMPRNLQYISFTEKDKKYLISHFHGIWYPKTKIDTDERIQQSHIICDFLSKRDEAKILCGDFNLLPTTTSMKLLEVGMRNLITDYHIPTTRNQHYEREEKQADYVLVSMDITIQQFRVLDVEVSDHLPLLLEFS